MAEIMKWNPNIAVNDDGDVVHRHDLTREEENSLSDPDTPYGGVPKPETLPTKEESIAKIKELIKRINESKK